MTREINNLILQSAPKHLVKDVAPNSFKELWDSGGLIVWSGASESTIFRDARVNWAFRALHDALHLKTGIGFSPDAEMHLGRLQASKYSGLMSDLVYIEVAGQAEHYLKTGRFVLDQVAFTLNALTKLGYNSRVLSAKGF